MKKSILIFGAILLIILLGIRAIRLHGDDLENERQSYIKQLGYDFSGEIDSLQIHNGSHGMVFFHITKGHVTKAREIEVNKKLVHHAELILLEFRGPGLIGIASETADKYKKGDSIVVSTDENLITVFSKGDKITESEVLPWLRGRQF